MLALFLTATSLAYVAGGPLSGGLLELDGVAGLDGWQWLFLVEGLPSVALGIVTLRYLDERPADADWLEPEERTYLTERLARELRETATVADERAGAALLNGQVWLLGFVNFILLGAGFGLIFFVPDLVQDRTGYSNFEVGLLAAVPFAIATVAMLWVARRADRAPSRRPYVAAMGAVGATGTLLTAYAGSPVLLTVGITLSATGVLSAIPVFWTLPTSFLTGTAAAAGIALIAVIGNLGGFVGPAFTGIMKDSTGGYEAPLTVLAGVLLVGSLLALLAREEPPVRTAAPRPAVAEA